MTELLLLKGSDVFVSSSVQGEPPVALSDSEILQRSEHGAVVVLLDDPAYLSGSYTVELDSRKDRKTMATAKFSEMMGKGGFGSWCVQGQHSKLFVWGLDSGSAEHQRLHALMAQGLVLQSLSSRLIAANMPASLVGQACAMRVICRGSCVQLALMLSGHWVFARRVDTRMISVAEAVASTVRYLRAQSYIKHTRDVRWQLAVSDEALSMLSELWSGEEPLMTEPQLLPAFDEACSPEVPQYAFNCRGVSVQGFLHKNMRTLMVSGLVFAGLLAAALLPAVLLRGVVLPPFAAVSLEESDPALELRYWKINSLQKTTFNRLSSAAEVADSLIEIVSQEGKVELYELLTEQGGAVRLRCEILQAIDNPLQRESLQQQLLGKIHQALPAYTAEIQSAKQYSIGGVRTDLVFEILLELRREQS